MSDDASETFIPLPGLVGSRLYSVTFIWDYQQLALDGPDSGAEHGINIYSRARVLAGDKWFVSGESGYRDALCDRIGGIVQKAGTDKVEKQIVIAFADDSTVCISLYPDDHSGPEAAEYMRYEGVEQTLHMVWRDE